MEICFILICMARKIKIDSNNIKDADIEMIADCFLAGKIIAYPTDTIYGLGCLATDKKAIEKIYQIKKRELNKPLIILVKSYCMLKKHCFVSKKQDDYLREVWGAENKKAVTVILKSRGLLPKELSGGLDSLAARLPKSEFLIRLLKKINQPIISTSLNISGEKNIDNIFEVEKTFEADHIDLIVEIEKIIKAKSSMLIDLRDVKNVKILRD